MSGNGLTQYLVPIPEPNDVDNPVRKLLEGELKDPQKVLEILVAAISGKEIDHGTVRDAVTRVLREHENQLRLFLVAQAKATLRSITRGMRLLDAIEEEWFENDFRRVRGATNKELLSMHHTISGATETRLNRVSKVVELKREIDERGLKPDMLSPEDQEIRALPHLTAPKREKMRRLLQAFDEVFSEMEIEIPVVVEDPAE